MAKSKAKKDATLPKALAARAATAARSRKERLVAEGNELVALVRQKQVEIADAFYDVGVALKRLREPEMLRALGCRTFAELCKKQLGFSVSVGERLVQIVEQVPRSKALAMGQSKTLAMVSLAAATPEADTPAGLYGKRLRLPDGTKIDPRTASSRTIEHAAKTIRQKSASAKPRRGRTTTADERAIASALQSSLHKLGARRVSVTAVATKPGQPSDLRIEHLPADKLALLRKALASHK